MGDKPLSWQQVLVVLLFLVAGGGALITFAVGVSDSGRISAASVAVIAILAIGLLWFWHVKANKRPDLEPDVLATIVDPRDIYQVGTAHFAVVGNPDGRVSVFVQNLYDTRTAFRLQLLPTKGRDLLSADIPSLDVSVPPSSVVEYAMALPLKAVTAHSSVRMAIEATARADGGRRVRFAQRTAATRRVRKSATAAVALLGALYVGGGTFLNVAFGPGATHAGRPSVWSTRVVYQPSARRSHAVG